jgi:hypothetical protein
VPNRCGAPRLIGSVQSTSGRGPDAIPEPRGNEIVVARLHGLGIEGSERVSELLFRPYDRYVTLSRDTFRFLPDHGSLPILLKVPLSLDYTGQWRLNEPGNELDLSVREGAPFNPDDSPEDRSYRIDFYAIPVSG